MDGELPIELVVSGTVLSDQVKEIFEAAIGLPVVGLIPGKRQIVTNHRQHDGALLAITWRASEIHEFVGITEDGELA